MFRGIEVDETPGGGAPPAVELSPRVLLDPAELRGVEDGPLRVLFTLPLRSLDDLLFLGLLSSFGTCPGEMGSSPSCELLSMSPKVCVHADSQV